MIGGLYVLDEEYNGRFVVGEVFEVERYSLSSALMFFVVTISGTRNGVSETVSLSVSASLRSCG